MERETPDESKHTQSDIVEGDWVKVNITDQTRPEHVYNNQKGTVEQIQPQISNDDQEDDHKYLVQITDDESVWLNASEIRSPYRDLLKVEEGDGVSITVSDDPLPRYPDVDPHDVGFSGVAEDVTTTGDEGNENVTVRVEPDHIPLADDDWQEEVELRTNAKDGVWRQPGVWVGTETSPTVEVDGKEVGGGPGWKALGLLATVERI